MSLTPSQASALGYQLSRQYKELSDKMYSLERRMDTIINKLNELKNKGGD